MTSEQPEATYEDLSDLSDWGVCLDGYVAEGAIEAPYYFYEKQDLLILNLTFLVAVWRMGTDEPLSLDNLERAAFKVARLRFPEVRKIRVSFRERWLTKKPRWEAWL